jgi:hypothetical protein
MSTLKKDFAIRTTSLQRKSNSQKSSRSLIRRWEATFRTYRLITFHPAACVTLAEGLIFLFFLFPEVARAAAMEYRCNIQTVPKSEIVHGSRFQQFSRHGHTDALTSEYLESVKGAVTLDFGFSIQYSILLLWNFGLGILHSVIVVTGLFVFSD